ncbi:PTB domain-containing engulfment adapter protein 1-like [Dysidea avara]|uniref:PTB domain-containing engulfment adapter protein 1-like n=1 Tax=Dysidea avara TaxID=196820 RepID=UPI0033327A70
MSRKGVNLGSYGATGEVAHNQKPQQEERTGGVPGGVKKRKWLHPVQAIEDGKVSYSCKFLGCMPVRMESKEQGSSIVRECVKTCKSEAFQKRERGEPIQEVSFNVSDKALRIQEAKSKNILYLHSLHYISYCTDEKSEGNNIFAYIARESGTKAQMCYVLEVDNLAREMAATLGQAFDLAYRKYLQAKQTTPAKEQVKALKTKVVTTDKEKEELMDRITSLEREMAQKSAQAELLKQQVIDLQDRRISDGVHVAEAPFDLNIPRPETKELDDIIANLESQIEQLGTPEEEY